MTFSLNVHFQEKEREVAELIQIIKSIHLASAEDQSSRPYGRMADSLEEAWNDLNVQLEGRRILLDTSVAFHHSVEKVRCMMELDVDDLQHSCIEFGSWIKYLLY